MVDPRNHTEWSIFSKVGHGDLNLGVVGRTDYF